MLRARAGLLLVVAVALMLAGPATAQDQRFAVRFGFLLLEPTGESSEDGTTRELSTQGGFEVDFEWYFHPRVGLDVSSLGSGSADVEYDGTRVAGVSFSAFTLGINGHVIRSEKVDFALGLVAGSASYSNFEVDGSTTTLSIEGDTTFGAQAFIDMTVSRNWAVNLGIKYLDTRLDQGDDLRIDFDPVIFRVMGVYRWGKHQ
jgi:outer membrane protein W